MKTCIRRFTIKDVDEHFIVESVIWFTSRSKAYWFWFSEANRINHEISVEHNSLLLTANGH